MSAHAARTLKSAPKDLKGPPGAWHAFGEMVGRENWIRTRFNSGSVDVIMPLNATMTPEAATQMGIDLLNAAQFARGVNHQRGDVGEVSFLP